MGIDFGALMQGFSQAYGAGQDRKSKREEMDLQKQLLTSKIKQDDIETEMKQRKMKIIMNLLSGQGLDGSAPAQQIPPMIARPTDGVPDMIAQNTVPMPVSASAGPSGAPAAATPTMSQPGNGSPIEGMMKSPQGQIALHEVFGFVPKPQNLTPRTIGGEGGRVTQFFDESGNPVPGKSYPEPKEITTEEINIGNQTFYRDIDKYTRQQVGELRPKQQGIKPLGTMEANTIALTKASLRDAQRGIDTLFSGNKESVTGKLFGSLLNVPGTTGREFSQAWDRASKPLMVALTGTGMSNQEAEKIINMSKPQPGDTQKGIQEKVESLVGFMDERLKLMDPTGDYGLVNVKLPWKNTAGMKTPPRLGGKASKLSPQEEAAAYLRGR